MTDNLAGHYSVALSYDPEDLRFGTVNQAQYFLERRRNRTLLQGKARIFQLHLAYVQSYTDAPIFTLLAYRDLLLSLALTLSIRCAQTRDVSYTQLTPHAKRYWQSHTNDFWPSVPLYEDSPLYQPDTGFYGLAGSLAFSMYQHQNAGQGLSPIDLIGQMLTYFYTDLGLDLTVTPEAKQAQLMGALTLPTTLYTQALLKLNQTALDQQPTGALTPLQTLRQNLLHDNDCTQLKQRLLLGEYTDPLPLVLRQLQALCNSSVEARAFYGLPVLDLTLFDSVINHFLTVAPPAGAPLVYLSLAVEGLYQAVQTITNLPDTTTNLAFGTFLNNDSFADVRVEVASYLATTYDAMGALALFTTLLEAQGLSYRFYLSALQLLLPNQPAFLPATGPQRLSAFLA